MMKPWSKMLAVFIQIENVKTLYIQALANNNHEQMERLKQQMFDLVADLPPEFKDGELSTE